MQWKSPWDGAISSLLAFNRKKEKAGTQPRYYFLLFVNLLRYKQKMLFFLPLKKQSSAVAGNGIPCSGPDKIGFQWVSSLRHPHAGQTAINLSACIWNQSGQLVRQVVDLSELRNEMVIFGSLVAIWAGLVCRSDCNATDQRCANLPVAGKQAANFVSMWPAPAG